MAWWAPDRTPQPACLAGRTGAVYHVLMRCAFVISLALAACTAPPAPPHEAPPELTFSDMTMYQYDRGTVAFRASAAGAAGDRHRLELTSIEVHHRGAQQLGALDIKAPHGSIDVDNNGFVLSGGVSLTDSAGRHLETDRAMFDPKQQRFEVPGQVKMVGRDLTFTAAGVSALLDSEELTFNGPIDGSFKMSKN